MTIRDLVVLFGFDIDRNSENHVKSSIQGLKNLAVSLLGTLGIGFSISGLAGLAEAGAEVEALESQFSQVFGEVEEDASRSLQAIADDTGIFAERMKGSFTQIAAFAKTSGMDTAASLDLSDRSMKAVADSAAFYDRSMEAVTDSLQSFLKGNFENDAALGLSCTETTRNAAANALYGKSFKDLAEDQKQLTLLKMVEDANAASGALGQAARESDTWTNQLGNLKQSIKDLKASAGQGILGAMVEGVKLATSFVEKLTEGVEKLKDKNGFLVKTFERVRTQAQRVSERLGGTRNVIKLLAVAAGSLLLVLNWGRIVKGAGMFADAMRKVAGAFNLANLKTAALVAGIILLVLLIEDFFHFLKGDDSVIGTLFEKAGMDADGARTAILEAVSNIRDFVFSIFGAVKDFLSEHSEEIKGFLTGAWDFISGALFAAFLLIVRIAKRVFDDLRDFWSEWGDEIMTVVGYAVDFIRILFADLQTIVQNVVRFFQSLFSGDFKGAWEALVGVVGAILHTLMSLISTIFNSIWLFIGDRVLAIKDTIVSGFQAAIDWITGLPGEAVQWGADIIDGIVSGISGAVGAVGDAVEGVAGKIRSFLHFSVPDEGPLTDFESWMPDMMRGLSEGIRDNEEPVLGQVRHLAEGIAALSQAVSADVSTAAAGMISHTATSITQNVSISNSYSGGSMETQKNVSRAMKQSAADATAYMARGLAYGRG